MNIRLLLIKSLDGFLSFLFYDFVPCIYCTTGPYIIYIYYIVSMNTS
ncbi:unnamed protein product [Brassica rapa]|uniref:Uncharacterized protein n=1 Tax=Brassica campestris TaxID=3711 RepID=A0A8D9CS93_BRACM|nr:unnamed protein product [Brassica rapa]